MGLINKFIDNVSKIEELVKFKPFEIHVTTPRHTFKEEYQILEQVLKGKDRLTEVGCVSKITIQLYSKEMNRFIFTTTLQEFPSCCGKLIMYAIKFGNMNYYNDNCVLISDKTGSLIITYILDLINDIANILHYSSVDFIISDVEQPFLLKSLRNAGLKEISSFQNRRNDYRHTCYNFSVNFPKITKYGDFISTARAVVQ